MRGAALSQAASPEMSLAAAMNPRIAADQQTILANVDGIRLPRVGYMSSEGLGPFTEGAIDVGLLGSGAFSLFRGTGSFSSLGRAPGQTYIAGEGLALDAAAARAWAPIAEVDSVVAARLTQLSQEGHALGRHGGLVTDQQLMTRAYSGVAPDGSYVTKNGQIQIPPSSTAFNTDALLAQSDLLLRQQYLDRAVALSNPGAQRVTIEGVETGSVVGRGYDRVTTTPGGVGPLQYHGNLTRVTGVYEFDAPSGTWRTVTIYPVKR